MPQAHPRACETLPSPPRCFRWRRLFRYRLRTFLVIVALIAAWLAWWSHAARRQREAVAALRTVGASVYYDFEGRDLGQPPYWPTWLVDTLGVEYFANIAYVNLNNTQVTDIGLGYLKALASLKDLDLPSQVTDAGLEHLKGLTGLQSLHIEDTQVTDAGLEHLKALTSLKDLDLSGTQVTDAGLIHLRALPSLKHLDLSGTYVSDERAEYLQLRLRKIQITDAGVEHLQGMTALQSVDLSNTQVTDAGVARLKQSLPNCYIHH